MPRGEYVRRIVKTGQRLGPYRRRVKTERPCAKCGVGERVPGHAYCNPCCAAQNLARIRRRKAATKEGA